MKLDNPVINAYPASKFAVRALTESLRQELVFLKSKIKITSISPGATESELLEASITGSGMSMKEFQSSKDSDDFKKENPKLKAKDVTDAVIYVLATPPHVQVHELIIRPLGEPL